MNHRRPVRLRNDQTATAAPAVPQKPNRGLYDPENEHDACGVGFVAHIKGHKSHEMVKMGLTILDNLVHRGAHGCDPQTGDGAGILLQIPDAFLRRECAGLGFDLPPDGFYGVGMVFLPKTDNGASSAAKACEEIIEKTVRREGQQFLGWRTVPTDGSKVGDLARQSEPLVKQFFVGRGPLIGDAAGFECKLLVIRKVIEAEVREATGIPDPDAFYIPSLSSRTIIYKGLLLPHQMRGYYPDLTDEAVVSAIALGASAVFHEHVPVLAPRAPLPLFGAQRRNKHHSRQPKLDAGTRSGLNLGNLGKRFAQTVSLGFRIGFGLGNP